MKQNGPAKNRFVHLDNLGTNYTKMTGGFIFLHYYCLYFKYKFYIYIIYLYTVIMLKSKKGIIVDVYNTLLYALVNYAISTSCASSANFK